MREYLEIGSTPAGEACVQVGDPTYFSRYRKECQAFINQLRRQLGPEPEGATLTIKGFPHDFGTYHEVVCRYDDRYPDSVQYAYDCEAKAPEYWDEDAKIELGMK